MKLYVIYAVIILIFFESCIGIQSSTQKHSLKGDAEILKRWDDFLAFKSKTNGVVMIDYASKAISAHFKNASD